MREFAPTELAEATIFLKEEQALTLKARDIVKKFEKISPHDYFKIEPQSYNLSIQYDQERKADENKAKQKEKKKKDLEDRVQGKKQDEIKQQLVKNKDDADREDKLAPKAVAPSKNIKVISSKSLPSKHKAMNQALELLV